MVGKKRLAKNFNISNRLSYTIIAVVALILVASAVYALTPGVAPNPGHLISELAPPSPCADGEFLKFNTASGGSWSCASPTAGMDDDKDGAIDTVFGGQDCNDLDNKINPNTPYVSQTSIDLDCSGSAQIAVQQYTAQPSPGKCACFTLMSTLLLYPSGSINTMSSCSTASYTEPELCREACLAAGYGNFDSTPDPDMKDKQCVLTNFYK